MLLGAVAIGDDRLETSAILSVRYGMPRERKTACIPSASGVRKCEVSAPSFYRGKRR
jgi:hypothetical protein